MYLYFILLFIFSLIRLESEQLKVPTQAKYALLINAETGAVLYEKNPEERCYPASTTKIATLIYLLGKHQNLEVPVTISKKAISLVHASVKKKNLHEHPPYILEHDGTMMGIKAGEVWPLESLLYGMMLVSGNDSANAAAEFSSGNIEAFMNELNHFIQNELGLKNTHFCNPHGLHLPDHFTTASDLAKITQFALRNQKFREIVQTTNFETPSAMIKTLVQHNRLLKRGNYFYSKAIGVKTGYHSNAGHNLVAAADQEGRCLIAILLGYEDPNQRYKDAKTLFEKAFKEKKVLRTLFAKQFDLFSASIPKADTILTARLAEDIKLEYFPAEEPKLSSSIKWRPFTLPIEKGGCVGAVEIVDEKNNLILTSPIYAEGRVVKKLFFRIMDVCKNHYFIAGLIEVALVLALSVYFRKRRLKSATQSSKERSSGRD
ncbi:MAG TPA: D-alanyl-D-alanine carboxypeptidase family protein [Rhabdochlamydiaceae bacterium]|nr:D-alanyl-D-alanine carboxypeptidase family protein [Rhabdochlamydiaceae bacterium]